MMQILKPFCWALCGVFVGCGDDLADNDYLGEPLVTIQGGLEIEPTDRPNETLQVTLVWAVEELVDYRVNENVDLDGEQVGHYAVEVLTPPPDSALNRDPETGGKIGFANVFAYDDAAGKGPISLADYEPGEYGQLLDRMRGGSPDVMLGYAKDSFPEGTHIATELGTAIEPGFFLVRFSGDCTCPFRNEPCQDSSGTVCDVRADMAVIPTDTNVNLTIVDDISTFSVYHTPDWLFLDANDFHQQ